MGGLVHRGHRPDAEERVERVFAPAKLGTDALLGEHGEAGAGQHGSSLAYGAEVKSQLFAGVFDTHSGGTVMTGEPAQPEVMNATICSCAAIPAGVDPA